MFRPWVRPLQINILIDSITSVICKKKNNDFWEYIERTSNVRELKFNGIAKRRHHIALDHYCH
jgi:hypothetical protein